LRLEKEKSRNYSNEKYHNEPERNLTMLCNDPKNFRDEMVAGYVAAYPNYIVQVPGGVAKATELPAGKVAVINGGGSGHFPAFCGIIGHGFMDATVIGNIFTSPSTDDVYHVAKSVECGSGILIVGGNYAGDKMNFDLARDRMRTEGIDARTFYITDDVASAAPGEWQKRRGNVGTFTVFKAAGAAAEAGKSLDEVVRLTSKCNDRTRTMSVGLHGCTLPGHTEPLFHVPEGKMEVGQGIHGEAGVYEDDLKSASEIAQLLVEKLLVEKPVDAGNRLAVILDGLGATKYEELFVVWNTVSRLLKDKGYELVEPQVGEFVTSLDMAGIALAITFLDDELEELWCAPADTPAFRKGSALTDVGTKRIVREEKSQDAYPESSLFSRGLAKKAVSMFERVKTVMTEKESELARIDSVAGDGDHGQGMLKGAAFAFEAIRDAVDHGAGLASALKSAGNAWASKAGGTSGVLWGNALMKASEAFTDTAETLSGKDCAKSLQNASECIQTLGKASLGDKTMLDALIPFVEKFTSEVERGTGIGEAWKHAAAIAESAAEKTSELLPKVGRARPQAQRSLGTPDAGAVSLVMCLKAAEL